MVFVKLSGAYLKTEPMCCDNAPANAAPLMLSFTIEMHYLTIKFMKQFLSHHSQESKGLKKKGSIVVLSLHVIAFCPLFCLRLSMFLALISNLCMFTPNWKMDHIILSVIASVSINTLMYINHTRAVHTV